MVRSRGVGQSGVSSSMDQTGPRAASVQLYSSPTCEDCLIPDLGIFGDTSEISSDCLSMGAIIADARIMIFAGFGVIICLIRG